MTRVLLVDANTHLRRLLRARFQRAGFAVREAATAAQALDLARSDPPDLIIHDGALRDADGTPMAAVLAGDAALAAVPRIELHARPRDPQAVGADAGRTGDAIARLAHPFRPAQLVRLAEGAVRRSGDTPSDG